jgi:hypothetical protein
LLEQLSRMDTDDDQFDAKFKLMRENFEHHADEEEEEMFPEARRHLRSERPEELGDAMERRKETLERKGGRSVSVSAESRA